MSDDTALARRNLSHCRHNTTPLNRLTGFSFDLPNVQPTAAHPRPHLIEIQIVRRQPHEKFIVELETQRIDRFARQRVMTADKQ